MKFGFIRYVFLLVLFVIGKTSFTQNRAARYEIDAKRIGVNFYDKDALPRSREFIRLDSTYYVGWYYEGMFKFDRAADYLGYKNCIPALKKALFLFERNYKNDLKTVLTPGRYSFAQADIMQIGNALYDSYSNVEEPDSAMWILDRIKNWDTGNDFMEYNIKAAWTIHRNRFYLNKYAFLKNSVLANEQLALNHLYTSLAGGDANSIFYLAIIHNYLLNIDSAGLYYDILKQTGGFSYNNYAHFQNTLGNFGEAITDFENDKYAFDKRLIESYYFLPTLFINSGKSKKAIEETNSIIYTNGSTPGFGWYNIALARSYLYNGQLDSCEKAITKAAQFREVHIGTTLGQSQYDFAVNVIKLMLATNKIERIKFLNSGWWYSLKDLSEIGALKGEQFLLKFALVNQISGNPERDITIYNIFSSENVIGFDEILSIMKNISPHFFADVYRQKMQTERRKNIVRYMQLFYGEFSYEDGKYDESRQTFENTLNTALLDTAHEKLFVARLYEGLARSYSHDDEKDKAENMRYKFFKEYPQLIPFSGFEIKMNLSTSTLSTEMEKNIIKELKGCDIGFTDEKSSNIPAAYIKFSKLKNKYEADYGVVGADGKIIIPLQKMYFKIESGVGKELGLRLFGVGGPVEFN
ncbi:MAG: tetratricopeptide repeat protein [Bacteroidota bacterium]|nr:tetratricopeptide repeat protein [Bacteroidota bacterium]